MCNLLRLALRRVRKSVDQSSPPPPAKMDVRESISMQNEVSMSLAKQVITTVSKGSNVIFSPASINVILSIIAAGSTGATKDQILSFLKFTSTDQLNAFSSDIVSVVLADGSVNGGPKLSAANGVWIDKSLSFKPSFAKLLEDSYKATSNQADFQTKAVEVIGEVNSWAEKETNGLINEVLPEGSADNMTKLIFANALYFKGTWNEKFDQSLTKEGEFHLLDGTQVTAQFMTSEKKQCVSSYDGFKVLGLPYLQGEDKRQFSMYFYLPDVNNGLSDLLEKIVSTTGFLDSHIPRQKVKIGEFKIPKFKFSFGFEASDVLKGLGLTSPFSDEDGLTEMVEEMGKNLCVSSIFHKACIEVNEEGTEAAAASAGVIKLRGVLMEEDEIDFVADHPFLLVVTENITGVVLFIGQVLDPLH
ncbi:Serpin-ZX [Cardamine amara subsp. amara]|uniref:Serpin-ZX n=1 Tax=Cardamine amara subsp. amara TaxID=228776 RepID=A0ABD1B5C5_CARAN